MEEFRFPKLINLSKMCMEEAKYQVSVDRIDLEVFYSMETELKQGDTFVSVAL